LILPGVGAFDAGMERLRALGLVEVLDDCALKRRIPVLGICLGSQLMARSSEEGTCKGLGWIDAQVVKFRFENGQSSLPLPHMGWNEVVTRPGARLFDASSSAPRFYFVHSYHLRCSEPKDSVGETTYGYPFTCAIEHDNLFGVQFHPEKSHRYGLALLKAFGQLETCCAPG
jgi:glutamine amidotransferase